MSFFTVTNLDGGISISDNVNWKFVSDVRDTPQPLVLAHQNRLSGETRRLVSRWLPSLMH